MVPASQEVSLNSTQDESKAIVVRSYGNGGKALSENNDSAKVENSDPSKIYFNLNKVDLEKLLKGTDSDRKKFLKDFNFSMLTESFSWSKKSALILPACIEGKSVIAVIDTGCSGVVISQGCFERLKLKEDDSVEFTLTSAVDTVKKSRKVFKGLEIKVGSSVTKLPAIVLEGLHFDALLGVNWITSVNAKLDVAKNTIQVNNEEITLQSFSEPETNLIQKSSRLYLNNFICLNPGEESVVSIIHGMIPASESFMFIPKPNLHLKGDIIISSDSEGVIGKVKILNGSSKRMLLQKNQCIGGVIPMSSATLYSLNKNNFSYFLCRSIDIDKVISHLNAEDFNAWKSLLGRWTTVFSKNKYDVGLTDVKYKIRLSTDVPIKSYIPRRTPAMIEAINQEIDKLEKANFIEPSISPYAAPTVCVKKKDGSLRVCIDFRMVNKNIINDAYPLHRIDDQLDIMAGSKVFTTLDLTKGYHQMKLDFNSREITGFTTPKGLYQWKVLPMGMKTSGAVFQRLMDEVLGDLQPKCAVVYIDDITIFSKSMDQHLIDVENVLKQLDKANLKVNIDKCSFVKSQVLVLGHIVSQHGILPNPEKIKAIEKLCPPQDITGVKSFLGVVNFYRRFIKNCSGISEPLIELTRGKKKAKDFEWGEDQQDAFEDLKQKLISAPILCYPDMSKEFFIETDASDIGIGAILSQNHKEEGEFIRLPVAFASKSLSKAERNYSTSEREGWAVVWSVKHFKPYIFGMHFTIITDHNALKALKDKSSLEGRLMRWAEYLAEFDYDIIYRPGKDNIIPDFLSRNIVNYSVNEMNSSIREEIRRARVHNKIYVPESQREALLQRLHRVQTGHLKESKFYALMKQRFYWIGLRKDVIRTIRQCSICSRLNKTIGYRPLQPIQADHPFQKVALDVGYVTIKKDSELSKSYYFIVAVDHFTKWAEVSHLPSQTSKWIMEFIEKDIIFRHGCPQMIRTDGGKPFVSNAIEEFFSDYNINHSISAPYHPESNGLAERFIQTIKGIMHSLKLDSIKDWKKALHIAVSAYRMVPHRETGFSPFIMLYGRESILPQEIQYTKFQTIEDHEKAVENHIRKMLSIHEVALKKRIEYQSKMKAYHDDKKIGHKEVQDFPLESLVWVNIERQKLVKKKGEAKWIGPCKVIEILPGPLFRLEHDNGLTITYFERVHPQFLMKFQGDAY